jgi:hypothetical protein
VVRPSAAALAAALVAADAIGTGVSRWMRPACTVGLVACAAAAVLAYARFGEGQFRDDATGRPTPVHLWDMSVYFPAAKYFPELGFDGLYLADAAALAENHGAPPGSIRVGGLVIRDLTTDRLRLARELAPDIAAVRARFSPGRWQAFRRDAAYFEGALGTITYLYSLRDHGANATPVWMMFAHLLFRTAPASERWLSLTALIDPLLLLIMFVAIGRTYGTRAALVAVIVWGTTSFSRFGTNLAGSTLRADWMAALGLGAAALRARRPALQAAGGGLVALSALLRAFPAIAAAFLIVPSLWALVRKDRADHRRTLAALVGAAVTVLVMVAASGATFSFSRAWGGWAQRMGRYAADPIPNHVGLRTVASFVPDETEAHLVARRVEDVPSAWAAAERAAFARHRTPYVVAAVLLVGAALLACRGLRLDQAALVGMALVPVVAYPANYYLHYVFLLPLVAEGRRFAAVACVILAMGVAQIPLFHPPWDVSFFWQSWLLLAALTAFGAIISIRRSPRSAAPALPPA